MNACIACHLVNRRLVVSKHVTNSKFVSPYYNQPAMLKEILKGGITTKNMVLSSLP